MNLVSSIMKVNMDGTRFDPRVMEATQGVVNDVLSRNDMGHVLGDENPKTLRDVVDFARSYFELAKSMMGTDSDGPAAGIIFGAMDKFIVPLEEMSRKGEKHEKHSDMEDVDGMSLI